MEDYKNNDELELYNSVIEEIYINHREKSITFHILKTISRLDRPGGFTYHVKKGILKFEDVVHANIPYSIEWDEWSEFYRSAVLENSNVLDNVRKHAIGNRNLKHIYLGIDYGVMYKEIDIVCSNYYLLLEDQEHILHDDFEWLFEK